MIFLVILPLLSGSGNYFVPCRSAPSTWRSHG